MTEQPRRRPTPRTPEQLAAIAAARDALPTLDLHELRALIDCPQTGKRVHGSQIDGVRARLISLGMLQRIEDPSWRFGRTVAGNAILADAEVLLKAMREAEQ